MPAWPELDLPYGLLDGNRIAANVLVRSAVFSTMEFSGAAERPTITEPLALATLKNHEILQVAGVRLSQSDADLFFWLVSRAYCSGAPEVEAQVCFSAPEALSALGRARGGKTTNLLEQSLRRLHDADFLFKVPNLVGQSRLLSSVEHLPLSAPAQEYAVTIAADVASLLSVREWFILRGGERDQLAGEPLARGLHAFYASHSMRPYPMWTSTLKRLMGRESMQESKWLHALDNALAKVKAASGWGQCERLQSGEFAGKVVITKGKVRRAARGSRLSAPIGE